MIGHILFLLAAAVPLVEMQHGLADARFVPEYAIAQRASAAQASMHLATSPMLGAPVSLTPNAPYAPDGSHLSFWKPSFVIGTANGGEAGINYWGKYQDGHMNVGFTPRAAQSVLLDCRMLSAGRIAYKIYTGSADTPSAQGEMPLRDGHFLLAVPNIAAGMPVSVELWPAPATQTVGIFGCDISRIAR
jgi:hypothetical protein